jgi:hypothetical protein
MLAIDTPPLPSPEDCLRMRTMPIRYCDSEIAEALIAAGFVTIVRDSQRRPVRKTTGKGLRATDEEVKAAVEAFYSRN